MINIYVLCRIAFFKWKAAVNNSLCIHPYLHAHMAHAHTHTYTHIHTHAHTACNLVVHVNCFRHISNCAHMHCKETFREIKQKVKYVSRALISSACFCSLHTCTSTVPFIHVLLPSYMYCSLHTCTAPFIHVLLPSYMYCSLHTCTAPFVPCTVCMKHDVCVCIYMYTYPGDGCIDHSTASFPPSTQGQWQVQAV